MDKKTVANVLVVVGIVIALASLLADSIGIGDDAGFGRDQTIGLIAGIVAVGAGLFIRNASKSEGQASD